MKFRVYVVSILVSSIFLLSGCSNTNNLIDEIEKKQEKETVEVSNIYKITEEEAINIIKKYLSDNGYHMSSNIEVDSIDGDNYLIHAYDIINNEDESHTATTGWFEVNIYTGEIKDIMKQ